MKIKTFILFAFTTIILASCMKPKAIREGKKNSDLELKGDKTIYGLACEGCTDSVLVLLPGDGSDPITYDIIDAHQNHKIFGKPSTGDWVGIVINEKDSTVADLVINLDELKGTWCYQVMPKMRDYAHMSKKLQARMMKDMPDSIKQTYLIPREYGFTLSRHFQAQTVGYISNSNSLNNDSPVVYPTLPIFMEWHIWNGKLVLTEGKLTRNGEQTEYKAWKNDTADLIFLRQDSLVLKFRTHTQIYYRRANALDANKKARAIAEKQSKQALEDSKKE